MLQESRITARKPRDAAAVRCGLKFTDIHYKIKNSQATDYFRATDIPAQERI